MYIPGVLGKFRGLTLACLEFWRIEPKFRNGVLGFRNLIFPRVRALRAMKRLIW